MENNIQDLSQKEIELIVSSAKRCLNFLEHFGLLLESYEKKDNDNEKKNINFTDTIALIEEEEAYFWFIRLIGAKYVPSNSEVLRNKREGYIPFSKVFEYIKDNNIPLLPWSSFNQNSIIYNENVENNYLSLEEEFTNAITIEEDYAGSYYFDDLFKIVTSKMRQLPRSNEIYELLSLCLISEFMGKEYKLNEINNQTIKKDIIKDLFKKYYKKFESDLKLKKPSVVESQKKCWLDLSLHMIQFQKKIIEIRTKNIKSYNQLISDEQAIQKNSAAKLAMLFSEINHFLYINNIDTTKWKSSSDFPSIAAMKKMSMGPTLVGKIQAGDGDKIKGFPLVREAYFADIISNNFAEKNAPKSTIA